MNKNIYILAITDPQSYGFSPKNVYPFADEEQARKQMKELFVDACKYYGVTQSSIDNALSHECNEIDGLSLGGDYAYISDMWYIELFTAQNPYYEEDEPVVSTKLVDYVAKDLSMEQMYELMSRLYEFRGTDECECIFDLQNKEDAKIILPSLIEKDVDMAEAFEARYVIDGLNYKKPLFLDTEAKMRNSLNGLLSDMEERFLTEFKDNEYSCEWISNADHFPYMDFIGFCNANLKFVVTDKPIDIMLEDEATTPIVTKVKTKDTISYEEALMFASMYAWPIFDKVFGFDGWDGETRFIQAFAEDFMNHCADIDWVEECTTPYDEVDKYARKVTDKMLKDNSHLCDYIFCIK